MFSPGTLSPWAFFVYQEESAGSGRNLEVMPHCFIARVKDARRLVNLFDSLMGYKPKVISYILSSCQHSQIFLFVEDTDKLALWALICLMRMGRSDATIGPNELTQAILRYADTYSKEAFLWL